MADAIQQSPFQYYPSMVSAGGGNAAAFESGYGAAQKEEANRLAMGTEEQQQRERKQIMEMRPQQMDIQQAQNRRAEEELKMRQAEHKYRMGALNSIAGLAGDVLKPSVSLGDSVTAPVTGAGLRTPGPQASYNPEADLPPTGGAPSQHVTNVNGYYIPGGNGSTTTAPMVTVDGKPYTGPVPTPTSGRPQWDSARGGFYTSDGRPSTGQELVNAFTGNPSGAYEPINVGGRQALVGVNPYGEVSPNASQFIQQVQGGMSALNANAALSFIDRKLGGGFAPSARPVSNYFVGSPETTAAYSAQATMREWYARPEIRSALLANPQALYAAEADPVAFYRENAASMAPQAGVTTPETPAATAATGAPAATSPAGIKTDATVVTGGATATGAPGKSTLETMLATGGNINLLPTTKDSPLMQPAYINDKTNALRGEMAALAQVRKIAAATRDYSKIPEVALREQAIKVEYDQLQKASSIIKFEAGDYAPLANLLNAESRKQGMNLQLEPITNDKGKTVFNIYNGDKLIDSNVTSKDIVHGSRMVYDKTYKEYVDALNKSATELNTYRLRQLYAGWGEGVKSQLAAEARAYENKHKVTLVPDASRQGVFVKLDDSGKDIGTVTIAPRIRPGKENESDPKKKYELDRRTNEPALFINEN
jgi:hypothetical protein